MASTIVTLLIAIPLAFFAGLIIILFLFLVWSQLRKTRDKRKLKMEPEELKELTLDGGDISMTEKEVIENERRRIERFRENEKLRREAIRRKLKRRQDERDGTGVSSDERERNTERPHSIGKNKTIDRKGKDSRNQKSSRGSRKIKIDWENYNYDTSRSE